MNETLSYPIVLDVDDLCRLLPHRGDMQLVESLTVLDHDHFQASARWSADGAILRGHFPGLPLVPGVMLVELVAQVAGAGMRAGSPVARRLEGDYLGLLAGIRKCSFKRPVLPDERVQVDVRTRPMSETAAAVSAVLTVGGEEAAQVEILVINSPRQAVLDGMAGLIQRSA
ncbi:3-hydroxyacyl-ACP dehydratase FabZ [Curvibacter fontanus]|mgnify:CR=1 FL=1|jgi:3-hydroxyacyl-[acyl-carrier-protein] dehydratase